MIRRNKTIYIMSALAILIAGTYWGSNEQALASGASMYAAHHVADADTQMIDLLASLNIQKSTQPVTAPDFELLSITGEKITLSSYRGKVVLIGFWTTW